MIVRQLRPWLTVRVDHDFYRSGLSDDLRFTPARATAELLARRALLFKERLAGFSLIGRVEVDAAAPHAESAPAPLQAGDVLRFLVHLRGHELPAGTELPSAGPYKLSNRAGSAVLCAGAAVGAADVDAAPAGDVIGSGAFASLALTVPAGGWPELDASSGHPVAVAAAFTVPFVRRSAVWRYHVVLKPGDTAAGSLSVVYAPPASTPYPAGVTFAPAATPADVQASYPGRTIATFASSAPLPFFETPLQRTALRRAAKTLVADLPNPARHTPGSTDVLVELR